MKPDFFDGVALIGFILLTWGIERLSRPAALITAGAMLLYFGYKMSGRKERG